MGVLLALVLGAPARAATIHVTSGGDDLTANGNCTLREAVQAAQTNLAVDLCAAGAPAQTDLLLLPPAVTLELGEIAVVSGSGPLHIRGATPGVLSTLQNLPGLRGSPNRLLGFTAGASVTLEGLRLQFGSSDDFGGAVSASGIDLTARDVTFNQSDAPLGGGLSYVASGLHHLLLHSCRFTSNEISGAPDDTEGGGAWISLDGGASARIVDTEFASNEALTVPGGGRARGGGVYARVGSSSSLAIDRTTFAENRIGPQTGRLGEGSGAYLRASGAGAQLEVVDSAFTLNGVVGLGTGELTGALHVVVENGADLALDRVRLERNDTGSQGSHLVLYALGDATFSASNLLLADGPDDGLSAFCGDGDCRIGHATITGHGKRAALLRAFSAGEIRLENSLLFAPHAISAEGSFFIDDSNLADGTNPQFVDAAAGDYRLGAGSPAIDFGDAELASVAPFDLAHAPRVAGLETDAGAYEFDALFADGFESGDRGAWSRSVP
jgi:CSLREA domain-containing protein